MLGVFSIKLATEGVGVHAIRLPRRTIRGLVGLLPCCPTLKKRYYLFPVRFAVLSGRGERVEWVMGRRRPELA